MRIPRESHFLTAALHPAQRDVNVRVFRIVVVNFLVMRKTHNCFAKQESVDPHVRADQMGRTVDVNEHVYTQSALDQRITAVNTVEKALVN